MTEKIFKADVTNYLNIIGFDTQYHEDKQSVGIPDMSYGYANVNGWVEFKHGPRAKWRPRQKKWLEKRGKAGGRCFLIWCPSITKSSVFYVVPWFCLPDNPTEVASNNAWELPLGSFNGLSNVLCSQRLVDREIWQPQSSQSKPH